MEQDVSKMSRADLEVQSRRMEAEMNVLSGRAATNPEAFKETMDERTKNYQAVQKRLHELDEEKGPVDPEGTSPTLADAEGNYAEDARVAHVGGIGVKDSNTDPEGVLSRQRKQLEKSGVDPDSVSEHELAGVALPPDEDEDEGKGPAPKPQGPAPKPQGPAPAKK